MEDIKQFITDYWPTVANYLFTFLSYFFVFLYRGRVQSTKQTLTLAMKSQIKQIEGTDKTLRKDMSKELKESKQKYQDAVNQISDLQQRLKRAEKTLQAILEDVEVPDAVFTNEND